MPVSIITLLVDFYTAATFSTEGTVYGDFRPLSTGAVHDGQMG